jgi:hypothetical protein
MVHRGKRSVSRRQLPLRANDYEAVLENRCTVTSQSIAGVDLGLKRNFGNSFPVVKLYWQYYF